MPSKSQPSQVVLVRRIIDSVIDNIAMQIAERRGVRDRTQIAVFGEMLSSLYYPLSELRHLQHAGKRDIPLDLKVKILEAEKCFLVFSYYNCFEEIKRLL